MKRYHKDVYIPTLDIDKLKAFNNRLNMLDWKYSKHCLDHLKYRIIDTKEVLSFIKNTKLDYKDIFEYYIQDDIIIKACYRLTWYDGLDIILVISNVKNIITIYLNTKDDKHFTLKKELYIKG